MKPAILILASLAVVAVIALQPPIPQDPAFHEFADQRGWIGLPNALNLLSNLPFIVIGALGLVRLAGSDAVCPTESVWVREVVSVTSTRASSAMV